MAVKKKNIKKIHMQTLIENSARILCRHCSLRNNCKNQNYKEKSEKLGINTYCTLTPNKKKTQGKK